MKTKKMTKLGAFVVSFFLSLFPLALEASLGVCSPYSQGESTPHSRSVLLKRVQNELVTAATYAKASLTEAMECFESDAEECLELTAELTETAALQWDDAKISKVLSQQRLNQASHISRNAYLNLIREGQLPASLLIPRQGHGVHFSDEELQRALTVWETVFLDEISKEIDQGKFKLTKNSCLDFNFQPARGLQIGISKAFSQTSRDSIRTNPLLAFIDEDEVDEVSIAQAIQRLIKYNADFINTVKGFRTNHSDNLYSQTNLTIQDHEMGLVNFPNTAEQVIGSLPKEERGVACASWKFLEDQQTRRVKTSVGVGFSTAVVCGVGVWSGIGTLPAIAACGPAIFDGLLGGYRGYADSRLAGHSAYAGRLLNNPYYRNKEIRSLREAAQLRDQGKIVMMVNVLGLIPVVRGLNGVRAAHAAKRSVRSLATLPATDSSVSLVEINAYRLATLIELARGGRSSKEIHQQGRSSVFDYQKKCQQILSQ